MADKRWRLLKDGRVVRNRFLSRETVMMYIPALAAMSVKTYGKLNSLHSRVAGWAYIDADGWRIEPYDPTGIS